MTDTNTNTDPELGEVTIIREFAAPRELVFGAMLDPAQLARFWGPKGTHTPVESIVVEARTGGRFETTMVADDGSGEYAMAATYLEIREPELIVMAENEGGVVTSETFEDLGDGRTRVTIHQTNVPEMFRTPEALEGFNSSLDRFEDYLAETSA